VGGKWQKEKKGFFSLPFVGIPDLPSNPWPEKQKAI